MSAYMIGPNDVDALQVAAECGVEHQRKRAERDHLEVRLGEDGDLRVEAPRVNRDEGEPRHEHDGGRHEQREDHALMQPPHAVVEASGAGGAGDERIEAEHQPRAENHDRREHAAAHARCGNRCRPEPSDHDRVDEAHAHPADFSEDNGAGETEEGTELCEHVTGYRLPSTGSRPRHAGSR